MSFFGFLKSGEGRKHLLRIVLVYIGIIALLWGFLHWYTGHGDQVSVPNVAGMSLEEAASSIESLDLQWLVVDSVYSADGKGGTVIEQSPAAESKVKEGRQVFLTIYRFTPPMETINIKEGEFGQVALIKLRNKGIKYNVQYEANNNLVGSVVRLTHRGKKLQPGDMLPRGAEVTITIGEATDSTVDIPRLHGLSYSAAMTVLDSLGLTGQGIFDPEASSAQDSALYRVCRQEPEPDPEAPGVSPGHIVDFWLYKEPCDPDSIQ